MTRDEQWLLAEKYGGVETPAFRADRERLAAGVPLAYLIGHIPFLDTTIHLDSHPLIPRPETECWTERAIAAITQKVRGLTSYRGDVQPVRVLDLCAGSGAIGVAVAHAVSEVHVTFAEVDPAHLPLIEKNLTANIPNYSNRMEYYDVIESDLFEHVTGTFDFILTNPPYIDPSLDRTEESVTAYEPHHALYGGRGGMEIIERIIAAAPAHLAPGGQLWLEHEPEQTKRIQELTLEFTTETHTDQYGIERYSVLQAPLSQQ